MQRTDQYHQSGFFTTDRWLQKRRQVQPSAVMIRDVIAVQSEDARGEFYAAIFDNDGGVAMREETNEHLVSRMIMHLHTVCMEARELHLKDNYVNPAMFDVTRQIEKRVDGVYLEEDKKCELIPGCENNITRVSFSEFSFYPYKDKGPLSIEAYELLISKLAEAAQEYPENMHILLATVPVNITDNQVVNLAIFIQCGRNPILHPFIKAIPSKVDEVYAGTSSRYSTRGGMVENVINKINAMKSLILMVEDSNEMAMLSDALHNILDVCKVNEEYRYLDHNGVNLLPSLVDLEAACIKLLQMIDSGTLDEASKKNILLPDLYNKIDNYVKVITELNKLHFKGAMEMVLKRQVTQVLAGNQIISNITLYPGGLIECVTLGGEKFVTIIDICLDHDIGLGRELFCSYMKTCLTVGQDEIAQRVSHIVTSNSVNLTSKNCVSEEVLHCDPCDSGIKDAMGVKIDSDLKVEISINSPAFGPTMDLYVYPSRKVPNLSGELNLQRERYNAEIRKKQRLRLLRLQQTTNPEIASAIEELDIEIHHLTVVCDLPASLLDPENKFDYRSAHPEDLNPLSLKNIGYVKYLLENGLNPNTIIGGMPLIHWAIKLEFNSVIFTLLAANGIDLTLRDHQGDTPLDVISQTNRTVMCCDLYSWTEDQETRSNFINRTYKNISLEMKMRLLATAVKLNRLTDVKAMLNCGANPFDILFMASAYDLDVVQSVFRNGDCDMMAAFYAYAKKNNHVEELLDSLEVSTSNELKMQLLILLVIDDNHIDMRKIFSKRPDIYVNEESFQNLFNMLKLFENDKTLGEICEYAIASGCHNAVMRELPQTLSQKTFDSLIEKIRNKRFRKDMISQYPDLADNNSTLKSESSAIPHKKRDRMKLSSKKTKTLGSIFRFLSNRIIEEYSPVPSNGEQVRSFNSDDIDANGQKIEMLSVKQSMN